MQVDDRLEVRLHLAVREELGEPVGARAVQQRLGRDRQALLVGEPDGEQAGALGDRERLDDRLQPLVPARAGQQRVLPRRYRPRRARRRGARPCRALTAGAKAVARHPWRRWRGSRPGGSAEAAQVFTRRARRSHLRGRRRPGAPNAARGLGARPFDVELVGEVRQHEPLRARARRRAHPPRAGVRWPRSPVALGPRQRRLDQQQVGAGGERRTAPGWARSRRRT